MAARWVNVEAIGSYFQALSDPRHTRNRKHQLVDIVVIAVCGMVCGCDGPTAIHRWAAGRREWLQQFLELPNGIPSRDCIRRLIMALKPEAFQRCFQAWIADAIPTDSDNSGRHVAIVKRLPAEVRSDARDPERDGPDHDVFGRDRHPAGVLQNRQLSMNDLSCLLREG